MLLRDRRNKMGLLRYARNDKMGMSLRGVKQRSNLKAQNIIIKKIWSFEHNTLSEAIRDRVLFSLILFAFVMILSSLIFAGISAEQYNKIVKDLGLTAISLIGIMISIFLGMGLVNKEIEKKTVYNIFSKPIRRYELN